MDRGTVISLVCGVIAFIIFSISAHMFSYNPLLIFTIGGLFTLPGTFISCKALLHGPESLWE